jgi:AGZA family xanthine/uracil permease-like MFS transporter
VRRGLFNLAGAGTGIGREAAAGTTTFLTMAYIIFVNPNILADAGMDKGAVITATALAAALGTLLAGLWANVPFAMAPGMGLNAFFAYALVIGRGVTWQTALGVVFVSGVLFLVLTLIGVRRLVVAAIPDGLRLAIAAGIGLFISFIGLQNLGLVIASPATLVGLGPLDRPVLLGLAGLVVMAVLEIRRVPGAILAGIAAATVLGLVTGETAAPAALLSAPPSPAPVALQLDIAGALRWGMLGAVFSFMFVDLFDSVGTVVACSYEAGLVKDDGAIERLDRVLEADAVATVAGALLGTSTTTTYIESGAGIAAGGRTGLASVVTAGWFLLALVATPLVAVVPAYATAPALIMVGAAMFRSAGRIDFARPQVGLPAFLTMLMMPLCYSISTGLAFGFLAHVLMTVAAGRGRDLPPAMWVIAAVSALDLVLTAAS